MLVIAVSNYRMARAHLRCAKRTAEIAARNAEQYRQKLDTIEYHREHARAWLRGDHT